MIGLKEAHACRRRQEVVAPPGVRVEAPRLACAVREPRRKGDASAPAPMARVAGCGRGRQCNC